MVRAEGDFEGIADIFVGLGGFDFVDDIAGDGVVDGDHLGYMEVVGVAIGEVVGYGELVAGRREGKAGG